MLIIFLLCVLLILVPMVSMIILGKYIDLESIRNREKESDFHLCDY